MSFPQTFFYPLISIPSNSFSFSSLVHSCPISLLFFLAPCLSSHVLLLSLSLSDHFIISVFPFSSSSSYWFTNPPLLSLFHYICLFYFVFPSPSSPLSLLSSSLHSFSSRFSSPLCWVAALVAGDNPCHGGWLGIRTSSLFTAGRMIQRLVAQAPAAAALCWISNMFEWDKRDSLPHRTPPPNPYTAVKWAGPYAPHLDPLWPSLVLPSFLSLSHTLSHTHTQTHTIHTATFTFNCTHKVAYTHTHHWFQPCSCSW